MTKMTSVGSMFITALSSTCVETAKYVCFSAGIYKHETGRNWLVTPARGGSQGHSHQEVWADEQLSLNVRGKNTSGLCIGAPPMRF